ncbi:MAG TPA: MaoC family dehydratase [Gemmataceae bacterium]|nr:MaoC family dehydratase [Gemmataceae bacterium]
MRVIASIGELRSLVGQHVGSSEWFMVTQEHINAFAEVTGDRQWIHIDIERARTESPFRVPIAHGFLTLSLLSQLHAQAVQVRGDFKMAINYGLNRVRYPAPVPAGSRIRLHSALQSAEDIPGGIQVLWLATMEIEGTSKPALVAEWLIRFYT